MPAPFSPLGIATNLRLIRFGRHELEGLLLEEFEGALWTRDLLEKARFLPSHALHGEGGQALPGGGVIGSEVVGSRETLGLGAAYPSTTFGGPPCIFDLWQKVCRRRPRGAVCGERKPARAEPIALRFETGRARLAGHFPELEDRLCALTGTGYHGPGSPDRADATVWAMRNCSRRNGRSRG